MARSVWTRRWIAASGGMLVNGLILGALALIEEPPPLVEEPPVILLDLESLQRLRPAQRRERTLARASVPASPNAKAAASVSQSSGPGETAPTSAAPTAIDPEWRIDQKAIDRWRITEGAPEGGWGSVLSRLQGSQQRAPDVGREGTVLWRLGRRNARQASVFQLRRSGGRDQVAGSPERAEDAFDLRPGRCAPGALP